PIAKAKSLKSKLFSIPDIQSVSKKAVVDRLRQVYPNIKKFEEKGEVYPIHIFLMKDVVEVTIDTTGPALHKRGYRERSGTAPLRETIAACMVMLTPWKKDRILLDPMCGSGTILIEAAMIGANIQPGVNRNFIGEKFHFLPKEDWMRARQDAIEGENMDVEMALYGSDIDEQVIELAKENAALAGVEEYITFSVQDMSEVRRPEEYGFLITNPPYGERIGEKEELEKTYCDLGKTISTLKNWSAFLITNYENTEKCIGKKATKKRKLYNGMLKTVYYQFPGPKPPKKQS
ncbi:THUMP domain-containing class I SAM-dependent RNA methyltransferase, partial [Filifactor alocis]